MTCKKEQACTPLEHWRRQCTPSFHHFLCRSRAKWWRLHGGSVIYDVIYQNNESYCTLWAQREAASIRNVRVHFSISSVSACGAFSSRSPPSLRIGPPLSKLDGAIIIKGLSRKEERAKKGGKGVWYFLHNPSFHKGTRCPWLTSGVSASLKCLLLKNTNPRVHLLKTKLQTRLLSAT